MQIEVVDVKFRNGNGTYSFSPNGLELNKGDKVIVDTEKGEDIVTVVSGVHLIEAESLEEPLKNVVKIATKEEVQKAEKYNKIASEYFGDISKIVKESGLEMKVVCIEASYDFSRIIVNFTAEERVDFRALSKKLAEKYRKKVELRQIGPRDAVKFMGGLGICGKECCCKQGFGDFDHVSIKMAKNQNLSLSPNSISGLCGKLLCCLAYENPTYVEALKEMPKVNSIVETPEGKGKVMYNDLLKKVVSVKFDNDGMSEIKEFEVKDIKFTKVTK